MGTVESISSGSSHFPGKDRHLAALTKQKQTSISDAVKGSGG